MRDNILAQHVKKFEAGVGRKISIEDFNKALSDHKCESAKIEIPEEPVKEEEVSEEKKSENVEVEDGERDL